MTSKELESILPEIVRRLVEALQPERIYLFGSHARGEARPCSDVDILVVVPDSDQPGYRRDRAAYHALWGVAAAADVLVWTHQEFEHGLRIRTSLSSSVQRTGRLLYAT
ncbi:MAG: DNA polymerase III subunit beta [Lentisphaerae bacterium RIFOXYB12_FULL_65_16]|nr:MAG: DNA polymerase III subunit beta [Lentisphaerae bacterium RIFOXYA12_64_32]OGV84061.1 MAG: DNA polymerase III subunit beta [Lentisphaerae bacterium RIFOXYB12_FULL_65_16]